MAEGGSCAVASPLLPLLLLLVTGLARDGAAGRWTEDHVINGCRFEPLVSNAVTMDCNYEGITYDSTAFRPEQIPTSIETMRISSGMSIVIADETLSSLTKLRRIQFSGMKRLSIGKMNWTQAARPEEVTITIKNVSRLVLDDGAFSGWGSPGPKIVIRDVNSCSIHNSAFDSSSVIQSVTLQDIGRLKLIGEAFRADIDQLYLDKVLIFLCQSDSFGGSISNFLLSSVTIFNFFPDCLRAADGWDRLIIRSCRFHNIEPSGISGRINDVVIENSRFDIIDSHGFHLNTSTFTMNSSEVHELKADALDVQFSSSVSLQESAITLLRADAFRRLKARDDEGSLAIQQLSVSKAEDGALAFYENARVTAFDVSLSSSCTCDIERQAIQLMVADGTLQNVTVAQRKTALRIAREVRCSSGLTTPTLVEFFCQNCPVPDEDTSQCPPTVSETATRVWVWPLIGVMLLLFLTVSAVVVTTLARRRRSQQKRQSAVNPSWIEQPSPKTDTESYYTELPANSPQEKQPAAPAGAVALPPDHGHHSPHGEPGYAEVSNADRESSATRNTVYVEMNDIPIGGSDQPLYANCDDPDHQQPLYQNCDELAPGGNGQPVYANFDVGRHH